MPIRAVPGGFQWGSRGKVYRSRAGAEAQARAAYANGYREDLRRQLHRHLQASQRAEARYVLDCVQILAAVHRGVVRAVMPQVHQIADHPLRQDADLFDRFVHNLFRFVQPRAAAAFDRMSADVDKQNAERLHVIGIRPHAVAGIASVIEHARAKNVQLLVDAGRDYADDVREVLSDPDNFGLRVEQIAKKLEERGSVSKSRAQLIARTETLKLNSNLTQHRQRASGIQQYTWSTSLDERVRPGHRELEGTVQDWTSPPETDDDGRRNHPGEDFNCRCVPIPYVPELEVLPGAEEEPETEPFAAAAEE